MIITIKPNDPIADLKLVDAYFRWALLAIVEVVGENGLDSILKKAGMEKFRQSYGSDQLSAVSGFTFRDYANINAGVMQVLGAKEPRFVFHSGRVSARHAMRRYAQIFHPEPQLVNGLLTQEEQLRASLETILQGYQGVAENTGQEYHAWLTDTDDFFYYHLESCAVCAGKASTEPICLFFSGSLMESLKWYTSRQYNVREVACRSMSDPACVWEIAKLPVANELHSM